MKKKKLIIVALTCSLCVVLAGIAYGCAPVQQNADSSGNASLSTARGDVAPDSLVAYHEALGQDFSAVTDVSVASCTSQSACHSGNWEHIVEQTDELWEGFGQIPAANPHYAHATNGFACVDCHSLEGQSVNQCNGCHNFASPSTWIDKDPLTTTYGPAVNESLY